jgi:uncharacterized iron-regulated membrane protein
MREAWILLCAEIATTVFSAYMRWFNRDRAVQIVARPPKPAAFVASTLVMTGIPIVLVVRLGT